MTTVGIERKQRGFTLVELLIALALGIVVLTVIYSTFTSQQDSYSMQSQVTMTQQNLRAALYMVTRDIQMTGYYTNLVHSDYRSDWDNNQTTADVSIRPLLYFVNDVPENFFPEPGIKVKGHTDIIVIIKAGDKHRELDPGESATAGDSLTADLNLITRDLDGDGDEDLNYYSGAGHSKYGLLVKKDLSRAEVFEVDSSNNFIFHSGLDENYEEGDSIHKLDVIMYVIENNDPAHPILCRRNIGTDNTYTEIAEDIDNMQFEFILNDGTTVNNLNANQIPLVRGVKTYLIARSGKEIKGYTDPNSYEMGTTGSYRPADGYVRRLLSAITKTRNLGQ